MEDYPEFNFQSLPGSYSFINNYSSKVKIKLANERFNRFYVGSKCLDNNLIRFDCIPVILYFKKD